MNRILLFIISGVILFACNDNITEGQTAHEDESTKASVTVLSGSNKVTITDTSVRSEPERSIMKNDILGFWGLVGEENATFVINKSKIEYPETFTSYNYSLIGDSIKINYDDYLGSFLVRMKGHDTLELVGDEEQVYYRIKK